MGFGHGLILQGYPNHLGGVGRVLPTCVSTGQPGGTMTRKLDDLIRDDG